MTTGVIEQAMAQIARALGAMDAVDRSAARLAVAVGGQMIDLSALRGIHVDRTGWHAQVVAANVLRVLARRKSDFIEIDSPHMLPWYTDADVLISQSMLGVIK